MAKFMQKKFVNFILSGNPNGGENLVWPRYKEKSLPINRSVMKFGDLIAGNFSSVIPDPMKRYRCDLWQDAPFREPEEDLMLKKQGPGNRLKQQVMSSPLVHPGL